MISVTILNNCKPESFHFKYGAPLSKQLTQLAVSGHLDFSVKTYLSQLLAILLLLKLLPVPIDLNILLMRLDHFILNLVCSFLLRLLLARSPVLIQLLRVRLDLDQNFLSLPPNLLNLA